MHSKFIKYFSTFDFNLGRMYKVLQDEDYRKRLAKNMRWSPDVLIIHAANANRIMTKRKQFLQSHKLLLETAIEIINRFPDRRIVTFSEVTDFADKLHKRTDNSSIYHSSINTIIRDDTGTQIAEGRKVDGKTRYFDKDEEPLTWKQIKKKHKGKLERISGSRLREESLQKFVDGKTNKIHTARALNEGVDIHNLDMSIKTSFNSTTIDSLQRSGRIARVDENNPDKRAIEVNLYFKNTQSEKWLKSSQKNSPEAQYIDLIDQIF